jgi:creatinine amidohydrolase
MTLKQLRRLDRAKTVVLQPIGMVEVHGEHLPLGTDTFAVDALTSAAVAWLLDRDAALHVLLLPTIPYGTDPVDQRRPDIFADAGSVWIGSDTLKAIIGDVVRRVVGYGFRYVFPLGFHGGGLHNIALGEICETLRVEFPDAIIAEPVGYVLGGAELDVSPGLETLLGRSLTPQEQVALQGSVHAAMFETSMMLAIHPELVDPAYKDLHTVGWEVVYQGDEWPGYIGAGPRHADPNVGRAVLQWRGVRAASLIYKAIQGEAITSLPRHPIWEPDEVKQSKDDAAPHRPSVRGPGVEFLDRDDVRQIREAYDEKMGSIPPHLRDTITSGSTDKFDEPAKPDGEDE